MDKSPKNSYLLQSSYHYLYIRNSIDPYSLIIISSIHHAAFISPKRCGRIFKRPTDNLSRSRFRQDPRYRC